MLEKILENQEASMSQQDDLNALVAQLVSDENSLVSVTSQVKAEVDALIAAQAQQVTGQPLDLTGLVTAVTSMDGVVAGLAAVAAEAAPAPSTPTPEPVNPASDGGDVQVPDGGGQPADTGSGVPVDAQPPAGS
jgi:hypothetical protein